MYGIQSYQQPEHSFTTWDRWQEELVKVRRLSNALKILGVNPDKIIADEKYDRPQVSSL